MAATEDARRAERSALDAPPELLRVATAGSVDDGKSTLIGRLLHDTRSIQDDQLAAVKRTSRERGDGHLDLALLTDGLRAEREQGITIDVAYRFFATPRRSFILADTPGHVLYTRNMVTGASSADIAVVLIDARLGVLEQSRRHAFITATLRVPHVVAVVNKMDLVAWDMATFDAIAADFRTFAERLGIPDLAVIPVSALHGDNVVERSERTPWYGGPPLLTHLEEVDVAAERGDRTGLRFPVQWVVRPHDDAHHDYRGYAGQLSGGALRVGDEVEAWPSRARSRIAALDTFDGPLEEAWAPMSITVRLEDDIDISRGEVLAHPGHGPRLAREISATLCWLDARPARRGARYLLKQTTRTTRVQLAALESRTDVQTLDSIVGPEALELNDLGEVRLRGSAPLVVDTYARSRAAGSFILIDEATNATVAAGMVLEPADDATERHSPNVVWQEGSASRAERWDALGQRGATVFFTGLPASGKSTLAAALERALLARGRAAYRLDGDNLRHGLCGDLGFTAEDRAENVRRAGEAARLLADAGTIALLAVIGPYAADRDAVRRRHRESGLPFVEVWVDTPLEECERRDPKGLYRRARAGELSGLTGVDAPYDEPRHAEVVLAGHRTVEQGVADVEAALAALGVLAPP